MRFVVLLDANIFYPVEVLNQYGIEALNPDEFIESQFGLRPDIVVKAAKLQRGRLKNPPKKPEEFLEKLSSQGLVVTAELLSDFKDVI